jgi:hypothetical protein
MSDAYDHGKTVLGAILADESAAALTHARQYLAPEHFTDTVQAALFLMCERYADQAGGVLPKTALPDIARAAGWAPGTLLKYEEYFDDLTAVKPSPDGFRWSVGQLGELYVDRRSGEAGARFMEILIKGWHDGERELKGPADAWAYLDAARAGLADLAEGRPEGWSAQVEAAETRLLVAEEARGRLAARDAPPPPRSQSGEAFLAQPDDPVRYRVDGVQPAGGNVVVAAQFKAGKTVLTDNLLRAYCDGAAFLGVFAVEPPPGRTFLFDVEMPEGQHRRWLRDQGIAHPERFEYVNLRGAEASLNLLDPKSRREWAARIRDAGTATVILDCVGPVIAALGLDESKPADVGRFLACFGELLALAGAGESVLVHHMGHEAERARGASRLRDWPDAEWKLVRQRQEGSAGQDDSPSAPRFFSALGRDVSQPEGRLQFDPVTRHLTLTGGSRSAEQRDAAYEALIEHLRRTPLESYRRIDAALRPPHTERAIRTAIKAAVKAGVVVVEDGPRRADLHSLAVSKRDGRPPGHAAEGG